MKKKKDVELCSCCKIRPVAKDLRFLCHDCYRNNPDNPRTNDAEHTVVISTSKNRGIRHIFR